MDGDEVPVPHFGLQLTLSQWQELVARVEAAEIPWIIAPTLRFKGMPGEQWTWCALWLIRSCGIAARSFP